MLLTLTTTHVPATDLGFLLGKRPGRMQSFGLSFGQARVFYSEATGERCTAVLMLDIPPVGLMRGASDFALEHYVNDRPYAASSFLSVALAEVYSSALKGKCKERPELAATAIPLEARLAALPCRGGQGLLRRLFEPLGYRVEAEALVLDPAFPEWGDSRYHRVTLRRQARLSELLAHLYVLVPVLDDDKHYYVDTDEVEKLLRHGQDWLPGHPERDLIARRYLKHQRSLARQALARLEADEPRAEPETADREEASLEGQVVLQPGSQPQLQPHPTALGQPVAEPREPLAAAVCLEAGGSDSSEETSEVEGAGEPGPPEPRVPLHELRLGTVLAVLKASGATSVLDLGCGEGRLLTLLLREKRFSRILGLEVSLRVLERAERRLKLDRLASRQRERIQLLHGSLTYRDARLSGFDAAAAVEVIEHLDPHRLLAFELCLFGAARPHTVALTTPNREYNVRWASLPAGRFRHRDHRFEWSRCEFQGWAREVAARHGYRVAFVPIGPDDPEVGPPTQMGVFQRDDPTS